MVCIVGIVLYFVLCAWYGIGYCMGSGMVGAMVWVLLLCCMCCVTFSVVLHFALHLCKVFRFVRYGVFCTV